VFSISSLKDRHDTEKNYGMEGVVEMRPLFPLATLPLAFFPYSAMKCCASQW